jgi:hypothetical protein
MRLHLTGRSRLSQRSLPVNVTDEHHIFKRHRVRLYSKGSPDPNRFATDLCPSGSCRWLGNRDCRGNKNVRGSSDQLLSRRANKDGQGKAECRTAPRAKQSLLDGPEEMWLRSLCASDESATEPSDASGYLEPAVRRPGRSARGSRSFAKGSASSSKQGPRIQTGTNSERAGSPAARAMVCQASAQNVEVRFHRIHGAIASPQQAVDTFKNLLDKFCLKCI